MEKLLREWEFESAVVLMFVMLFNAASPYDNVRFCIPNPE
jgi:hypothetical protein